MEVTWRYKRRSSVGRRKKEAVSGVSPLSSDPWPISLHLMGATCSLSSPPYPWIRQLQPFSLNTWWVPVPLHHLCAQSKQTEGRAAYPPVAVSSHAFISIIIITEYLLGKYHVGITLLCIVPFICLAFHVRDHDDYLLTSYYHNKHIISLIKWTQDPPWTQTFAQSGHYSEVVPKVPQTAHGADGICMPFWWLGHPQASLGLR